MSGAPRDAWKTLVVLPTYRETRALAQRVNQVAKQALERSADFFLWVDDGSGDASATLLQELVRQAALPNLGCLLLPANVGKGGAIAAGFASREARHYAFLDGDLPYDFAQLDAVVAALDKAPIAIGSREVAGGDAGRNSLVRALLGKGFNKLVGWLVGLPYEDTQAGLKAFRHAAMQTLFQRLTLKRFSFDVELLFIARCHQLEVTEVPVRSDGEHSYKTGKLKLLRDSWRMFWDLVRIRYNHSRGRYA